MTDNAKYTLSFTEISVVIAFGGNLRMLLLRTHLALIKFIQPPRMGAQFQETRKSFITLYRTSVILRVLGSLQSESY